MVGLGLLLAGPVLPLLLTALWILSIKTDWITDCQDIPVVGSTFYA